MTDISEEITAIQTAVHGEDVRAAVISAAEKLNADLEGQLTEMQLVEDGIAARIEAL